MSCTSSRTRTSAGVGGGGAPERCDTLERGLAGWTDSTLPTHRAGTHAPTHPPTPRFATPTHEPPAHPRTPSHPPPPSHKPPTHPPTRVVVKVHVNLPRPHHTARHQPVLLPCVHVALQLARALGLRQRHDRAVPPREPLLRGGGSRARWGGGGRWGRGGSGCERARPGTVRARAAAACASGAVSCCSPLLLLLLLPAAAASSVIASGPLILLLPMRACRLSSRFLSSGSPSSPRKGLCVSSTNPPVSS